jgi:ribonuclease PH
LLIQRRFDLRRHNEAALKIQRRISPLALRRLRAIEAKKTLLLSASSSDIVHALITDEILSESIIQIEYEIVQAKALKDEELARFNM